MEALAIKNSIKRPVGLYLGIVGIISIILGLVRGIFYAGINNWESLLTPYGRNFISAIFISFLMILIGRFYGHNLVAIPWKDENTKKKALIRIYLAGSFILICYAMLLLCMVAMRFGGI